ncbi:fasciclin domain-containing protein [Mucilaginibacter aquaedulcis]|uniref:fasciclin domain-containing protein n=1 Tax=Mucilaginibacter aquaedulcis TaxID=1187081 RepID=UPI0025B2A80F|nr:fasciclin domain-containing protein [Mucilaginibacter aquaedulcis]MDN3546780.1 fasciclin domain-containing protein [Mucilaginibacter aquaedulcis]
MKKIVLLNILLLFSVAVFAQTINKTDSTAAASDTSNTTVTGGMQSKNDIMQNMALSKGLSVFYNFIKVANLTETYESRGPITVFAPVNEAFKTLQPGKLDSLARPAYVWELTHILTYHAIAGKLSLKDIQKQINGHNGTATFTTLGGSKLTAKIDSNHNIILEDENGGQSMISRIDIEQSNGVLHVVNKVLIPKAKAI